MFSVFSQWDREITISKKLLVRLLKLAIQVEKNRSYYPMCQVFRIYRLEAAPLISHQIRVILDLFQLHKGHIYLVYMWLWVSSGGNCWKCRIQRHGGDICSIAWQVPLWQRWHRWLHIKRLHKKVPTMRGGPGMTWSALCVKRAREVLKWSVQARLATGSQTRKPLSSAMFGVHGARVEF